MAETPPAGGNTSRFGFLARKVGPLPVWAWGGLAVGAYYLWQARQNSASSAAGTTPAQAAGGGGGTITQNLTERITGPLSTTGGTTTGGGVHKCPKGMAWDSDEGKCVPEAKARSKHPRDKKTSRRPKGKTPQPGGPFGQGKGHRPVDRPPGKGVTTKQTTTAPAGAPAPQVSTVQQAGIITAPAYIDTSGGYQREPAMVPRLVYPVVPSAPGQPPVSPPDETEPATSTTYAPMTAGAIYDAGTVAAG